MSWSSSKIGANDLLIGMIIFVINCLSAVWTSGSERRFSDDYDLKVDIKEVRSKTQTKNFEIKTTPEPVWIRPMYSASIVFL